MEQKFSNNSIGLQALREFCEREGEAVAYRKGEQMECEGEPARWFGFVTEGCLMYNVKSMDDDKEHITWFSFDGEYAGDYPACLDGSPAMSTIEAMEPTRIIRVSGEQLLTWFRESHEGKELRGIIGEHLLSQARRSYLDFFRSTPRGRYKQLLRRCPGIVDLLDLQDIASLLNVHPNTISKIRRDITFDGQE